MEKQTKMQFFYLGKSYGSNPPKTNSFKAYKYKDKETKKITLYPIKREDDKDIFIYGVGTKRIAPTKVVDVPVFDLIAEHWNDYREKYGDYCLYYSIDGSNLSNQDCCGYNKRNEYKSIIETGVEKYTEFITLFNQMYEKQNDVIKHKYLPVIQQYTCFHNEELLMESYLFRPQYHLFYTFFNTSAMPDVLNDDKRMESLYKDYRTSILKSESDEYKEYLKLEKEKKRFREDYKKEHNVKYFGVDSVPFNIYAEYEKLDEKCYEYYRKIRNEIDKIVDKEINTDNDVFPTSVEDRIKFLFGEEISNIYNEMVDKFIKQ